MLGARGRELRIGPERAWFVLASYQSSWGNRCGGEACRVFRESIVVLLEPVDLKKIVISTIAGQNWRLWRQDVLEKHLHDVQVSASGRGIRLVIIVRATQACWGP